MNYEKCVYVLTCYILKFNQTRFIIIEVGLATHKHFDKVTEFSKVPVYNHPNLVTKAKCK